MLDLDKAFLKPQKNNTNQQQKRIYCDPYSIKPSFYLSKKLLCRFKSVSFL
ncbi:hypothetical protein N871_08240 [Helicobacter pylori X47-2AL]|uniref:Uncharacterized protein n=1 Tax=Helicobacter pylori X47-2AL TaxID=1386083 RepID=V6L806_HELPX|nr:hypothetical protein N871_08240 [Helicobacter pylori X47-2AL]